MSDQFDDNRRHSPPQEEEVCDPQVDRDGKGRFRGCGNKNGRPKKAKPLPPRSAAEAAARSLMEPVTVTIKGKTIQMPSYEAWARRMTAALIGGSPTESARIFRMYKSMGVFEELRELEAEKSAQQLNNPWTDELEAKYRMVMSEYGDIDDGEPSESLD